MGNFLDKLLGIGENLVDGLEKGLPDDYGRETDDDSRREEKEKHVINPRDMDIRMVGRIHHAVIDERFLLCATDGKSPDARLIGDRLNFATVPEGNAAIMMCPHCVKALLDLNETLLKRVR